MPLVVGTTNVRTELGTVADYCPVCHDIRPCTLHRVTRAIHAYGVPIGKGDYLGDEIRCDVCRFVRHGNPELFENVGQSGASDLETLVQRTQPRLRTRYAAQLELDERMRKGSLTREERQGVLLGALRSAEALLQPRTQDLHFDAWAGLGCFLTVAGAPVVVMSAIAGQLHPIVAGAIALLVIGGTVKALWTDVPRHARKVIAPRIARGLRPLAPEIEEIETALRDCAEDGMSIGAALRAMDLHAAIARAPVDDGLPEKWRKAS
jgi:hypothetical protein